MDLRYVESCTKQFEYYKMLGDKTIAQLENRDLFWQPHPEVNSVAIIVKHLWGNMMSRWTNFLEEDGEKSWRNREAEFVNDIESRDQLLQFWEEGWSCLFQALQRIDETNLNQLVYIRNMGHTIPEAIHRQMCHYSYHVGQMVLLGKLLKKDAWESLSIPRGQSKQYNQKMFEAGKREEHFTTQWIPKRRN